jgi:hypothetical protein
VNNLWMFPLLAQLGAEAKEKLRALSKISNHSEPDLVVMILEGGIFDSWEGYRNNPKHSNQIEDYERNRVGGRGKGQ